MSARDIKPWGVGVPFSGFVYLGSTWAGFNPPGKDILPVVFMGFNFFLQCRVIGNEKAVSEMYAITGNMKVCILWAKIAFTRVSWFSPAFIFPHVSRPFIRVFIWHYRPFSFCAGPAGASLPFQAAVLLPVHCLTFSSMQTSARSPYPPGPPGYLTTLKTCYQILDSSGKSGHSIAGKQSICPPRKG